MTLNAVNQIEKKAVIPGKKKPKAVVVCDSKLTEEELNEYVTIIKDEEEEKQGKRNKKKEKGPDTGKWNKLTSGNFNDAEDDDMADFKFVD